MTTPPLHGLLVLDLSTIVSGGTTTAVLADFGARVIKVEQPRAGDPLRAWGPVKDGVSLWWKVLSRNKESITLDLRAARGQALLRAVPQARPGAKKRRRSLLTGDVPSPIRPPPGCRFHPRCPLAVELCRREEPALVTVKDSHQVACHLTG